MSGNNTVTFNELTDGEYNNCTISIQEGNYGSSLLVTPFTVDTTGPFLSNPSNIGTTTDTTPDFTFTSSEAGQLTGSGGCTFYFWKFCCSRGVIHLLLMRWHMVIILTVV